MSEASWLPTGLKAFLRSVVGLLRRFPYRVVSRHRYDVVEKGRYEYVPKDQYDCIPKGEYVFGARSEYLLVRKNRYRVTLLPGQERSADRGVGWIAEDNTPEGYDRLWGSEETRAQYLAEANGARARLTKEIVDHVIHLVGEHSRVVDIGCGVGELLVALRFRCLGISVAGLDFSAKAIEGARRNLPDGEFVLHEIANLPYPTDAFDLVLCTDTLEHMERPREVVEELVRICGPGGHLVIVVPDGEVDDFFGHIWFWNGVTLSELLSPWGAVVQRLPDTRELLAVIKVGEKAGAGW